MWWPVTRRIVEAEKPRIARMQTDGEHRLLACSSRQLAANIFVFTCVVYEAIHLAICLTLRASSLPSPGGSRILLSVANYSCASPNLNLRAHLLNERRLVFYRCRETFNFLLLICNSSLKVLSLLSDFCFQFEDLPVFFEKLVQ